MDNLKRNIGFWVYNTGNIYESTFIPTNDTKNILLNWVSGTGKGTFKRGVALTLSTRVNYDVKSHNDFISEILLETTLAETKEENKTTREKASQILGEQFNLDEPKIKYKSFFSILFENDLKEIFLILTLPKPNQRFQLEKHFIKFKNMESFEEFKNMVEKEMVEEDKTILDIVEDYESGLSNSFFEVYKDKDKNYPLTSPKSKFYSGYKDNMFQKIIMLSLGIDPKETLKKTSSSIITERSITDADNISNMKQSLIDIDIKIANIIKFNEENSKEIEDTINFIEEEKIKLLNENDVNYFFNLLESYNNSIHNKKATLNFEVEEIKNKRSLKEKDLEEFYFQNEIRKKEFNKKELNLDNLKKAQEKLYILEETTDYDFNESFENVLFSISKEKELLEDEKQIKTNQKLDREKELNILKIKKQNIKSQIQRIEKDIKGISLKIDSLKLTKEKKENLEKTVFNNLDNDNKYRFYIYNSLKDLSVHDNFDSSINDENIIIIKKILLNHIYDFDIKVEEEWLKHIEEEKKNTIEELKKQIELKLNELDSLEEEKQEKEELLKKVEVDLDNLEKISEDDLENKIKELTIKIEDLKINSNKIQEIIFSKDKEALNINLKKIEEEYQEAKKLDIKNNEIEKVFNSEIKNLEQEEKKIYRIKEELKEFKLSKDISQSFLNLSSDDIIEINQEELKDIFKKLQDLESSLKKDIENTRRLFSDILMKLSISPSKAEKYNKDRDILNQDSIDILKIVNRILEIENGLKIEFENREKANEIVIDEFEQLLSNISRLDGLIYEKVKREKDRINKKLKQKKSISAINYEIKNLENIDKKELDEISSKISGLFKKEINFFDGSNLNNLDYNSLLNMDNSGLFLLEDLRERLKGFQKVFHDKNSLFYYLNKKIKDKISLVSIGEDGKEQEASGGNSMAIADFARKEFLHFIKTTENKSNFSIPLFFDEISKSDVSDVMKTIDDDNTVNFYLQQGTDSVNQDIIDISTVYESERMYNVDGYFKSRKIYKIFKTGEANL